MNLINILSIGDSSGRTETHHPTDYVTDRLEAGRETINGFSTRVRRTAGEQVAGVIDRGVDELRTQSETQTEADIRKRLVKRAANELCEQVLDRTVDELREQSDVDLNIDGSLESFLRRYNLNATRLDDETVTAIQNQLASETAVSTDELLEQFVADDSRRPSAESDAGSQSDTSETVDHALTEAYSHFCAELNIETDQPLNCVLEDTLQRDAVVVGHALEQTLTEGIPQVVGDQSRDVTGAERSQSAGTQSSDATKILSDQKAGRPSAAMALAATALLSDDVVGDGALTRMLPALAANLTNGGSGTATPERVLFKLLSNLVLETGDRGVDLAALRSQSTGSLALVALFVANLVAMGLGAWISRKRAPPIPEEIRGPDGEPIVTDEQVQLGKKAFQANGLMNLGSILGNGSYFGVDLTADALALKAEFMREYYARQRGADSFDALDDDEQVVIAEHVERELDTDAPEGSVAHYSAAEAYAHHRIRDQYVDRYYGGSPERGIPSKFVRSADHARRIADFACWTAWMSHTNRPGSNHSYTNDWPYVPGTGNRPTGQVLVWSTISVILLIAGGGVGVWAYHSLDFAEPTTELIDVPSPDDVSITPTQCAAAWYVPVAGALFAAQALVGALLAHYYVERTGFYGIGDALGIDIVSLLPFSLGRTWHVNLGILWITTLWLAGGLFLPGLFSDHDPPWQAEGTTALLGVLVLATVGAFTGVWLGTHGKLGSPEDGDLWWWLGSEGLEYLEVGRLWKVGLLGAFVSWTGLVLRSVRQLDEPVTGLGHFMTYAGGSIALMFAASMLYTPETNMAVTEFWRWWVVHMWVEGVFEFFVTAVISVALVSMDLLERGDAEKAIFFEVFTIMAAGIVGVSHHYWWVGLPDFWVPLGTTFSTLEFVPLVFVLYRSFGEYRSLKAQDEAFPYTIPLLFIVGSSIWNFVGGGVLGFFINLPIINYYEHGTYLTVAHAHTSLFGAFGLLALGLGVYILRVVTPEAAWDPTWFRGTFWLTNVGLVIMSVASLLPIGFVQLQTAYQDGYAVARSLEFYEQDHVQTLLWARTLGDTPMILGALAFTVGAVRHLYAAQQRSVIDN